MRMSAAKHRREPAPHTEEEYPTMADVTQYHVLFYGTSDGYQGCRAQIALYTGNQCIGYARFHDAGMPFPADSVSGGQTIMHLPTTLFDGVLDVLRNERPITFYFASNHAFLGTGATEPVGEAES
jgi:hypothetical protein